MRHFEAACLRWGLVISSAKTECMVVDSRARQTDDSSQRATRCQQCGRQDGEVSMLLCDCCQQGWHMHCLQPPLLQVPQGEWLCPGCTAAAAISGGSQNISASAPVQISIGGELLAWVQQFKYLGSQFSSSGSLEAELRYRTQQAWAAFRRLDKAVFNQRCISTATKMKVYRPLVSQVLLYGSHCWPLAAAQLEQLEALQHRHLRRILGVRLSDMVPNSELLRRCQQPTLEAQLLQRRGAWVGHTLRMDSSRLAQQLLFSSMPGQRRRGGQFSTLVGQYKADVLGKLSSQQQRDMWGAAAMGKTAWNALFSAKPTS